MSLPTANSLRLAESMRTSNIRNLIAQAKAKQVLLDVREAPDNFPKFSANLDERVTFVAYAKLSVGCSLIETGEIAGGRTELHDAADILESVHRALASLEHTSALHCLIGAMAFYSCGQYSRAFVLIRGVDKATPAAAIIASFLRKNHSELISALNNVLLKDPPTFQDSASFDEWAITMCIARAVSFTNEHILSGKISLLTNADAILADAMEISGASSNPGLWWIARLLRLMFKSYAKGTLWSILPPYFEPGANEKLDDYIKLLALSKPPVIELWESQIAALHLALDIANLGGVINLRTSAGKTRVAELAILQTLKIHPDGKILYLAPFRSLALELESTFSRILSPLGYQVSHLYGGLRFSGVDRELINEGHVTIATPEKAKAMLRAVPELFEKIKLIIIDEGHLLGGNERNVRNELFLEHLRLTARKRGARILLLSAVLPNPEDLALWIGGDTSALAKSNWKPSSERFGILRWKTTGVSIEWLGGERCFNPHFIEFKEVPKGKKSKRMFPGTKSEAVAATAARLAEFGPVLIFAGQARLVAPMVKNVLQALGQTVPDHPWPETEWKLLVAVCKEELGDESFEVVAARKGVIAHSNKLSPQVRISIEKLIAKCPPKIIVATTTLGQGVNIGISSVIIATTQIGHNQYIQMRDFWNICGRAGRAFVDNEGKILFAVDATQAVGKVRVAESIAAKYFDISHLDRVNSGLLQLVRILYQRTTAAGIPFDTFLELAANDDFSLLKEQKPRFEELLDLIDDQLLSLHIEYKGDDSTPSADWVEDAFRESLAAIQERAQNGSDGHGILIRFLKARAIGILQKVKSPKARRAIVASGLPLTVGLTVFNQLDTFRQMVDRYLAAEESTDALNKLIFEIETWARDNAKHIVDTLPDSELLNQIRPHWITGAPLRKIVEISGDNAFRICSDLYGYKLPWLMHSIAQKMDKDSEQIRIKALARAALLLELGLPSESAAKVFLAGVRSRVAAIELSRFVTNPDASSLRIRAALLNPAIVASLSAAVSPSTYEWLNLLSADRSSEAESIPKCSNFRLDAPENISILHARRLMPGGPVWLCSIDARFKRSVKSTETLPFAKFANDQRCVFVREGGVWVQYCRDPRIQVS